MLCQVCWRMLRGQAGKQWKGPFQLNFSHHGSIKALKTSYDTGCSICRALFEEVVAYVRLDLGVEMDIDDENTPEKLAIERMQSTASLATIDELDDNDVFRLDFKLEFGSDGRTIKRTFILKQIDSPIANFQTPMSTETSSREVFNLAMSWLTQCNQKCDPPCAKLQPVWYPTRLIDIRALKPKVLHNTKYMDNVPDVSHDAQNSKPTIRLVERPRDDPRQGLDVFGADSGRGAQSNNLYTTLSHCWGQSQHYILTPETAIELKNGIETGKLPKTFRDAIAFAAQIENVGWIWIDSLCIYQRGPESEQDWIHEAALMQRVYQESYLNISATAASNSGMGLYWDRDCSSLWENEVNLNIDGIPGPVSQEYTYEQSGDCNTVCDYIHDWFLQIFGYIEEPSVKYSQGTGNSGPGNEKALVLGAPMSHGLRRCILIDASNWDHLVNKAPVNTRAWVLQERLLAPRVLHFCKGSIAWECGRFTRTEGQPEDVPAFDIQQDKVLPEVSFKGLDPFKDGKKLRNTRLGDYKEPDPHIPEKDRYGYELWARVVEMYSTLNLTKAKDKLMALSGIAQYMATNVLGSEVDPPRYVAGLWYRYFESQLLWRVEPIFSKHDRIFHHPSTRPGVYRAPSFSWASIDAQKGINGRPGSGIMYGEVTDRDMLIEVGRGVNDVVVNCHAGNSFGLVTGGHIMLYGKLRRIRLSRWQKGMFYWRLLDRDVVCPKLDKEKHHNVYLDAPDDDDRLHGIFESDNVYCVPAAFGPRSEHKESKYLLCLILQQAAADDRAKGLAYTEQQATFRRIGMTKLSGWRDTRTYEHILTPHSEDADLPCWPSGFDAATGRHLIRII